MSDHLERLVAAETRLGMVCVELERLRDARGEDRAEIARVAAAYEMVSLQLQELRAGVRGLDERMGVELKRIEDRVGELQAAVISQAAGLHNLATAVKALTMRLSWRIAVVVGVLEVLAVLASKALG